MDNMLTEGLVPGVTENEDGSAVIDLGQSAPVQNGLETSVNTDHVANLAELMTPGDKALLVDHLMDRVDQDIKSRERWASRNEKAVKLMGMDANPTAESEKGEEYSAANHQLLLEAHATFLSTILEETVPVEGPARADPVEEKDEASEQASHAVQDWANDYLLERLEAWVEEHERTMWDAGLFGCGFKKIYTDETCGAPIRSMRVAPEDLIVSFTAEGLRTGRVTHRQRWTGGDMIRFMDAGRYSTLSISSYEGLMNEKDKMRESRERQSGIVESEIDVRTEMDVDYIHEVYEVHVDLRLFVDKHDKGLPRPYIVDIHPKSRQILAIRRNWMESDPKETRVEAFVAYLYFPGQSSIYGVGLGQLLSGATEAIQEALRAGLTAAHLANHPVAVQLGTFGHSLRKQNEKLRPGEIVTIDMPTGSGVQNPFQLFPFNGMDQSLNILMEKMEDGARRLAGTVSMNIAETASGNTPVGTAMAAYDAATVIPRAVHRKIYRGLKDELRIFHHRAIQYYGGQQVPYGEGKVLQPGQLELVKLSPAMKPGSPSRMRRVVESQTVMEVAKQYPQYHDEKAMLRRTYRTMGVDDADELLLPDEEGPQPTDPLTEMNMAVGGQALVAGFSQHHDAHVASHIAAVEILRGQGEAGGGNTVQAVALLQAHIGDHVAKQVAVMAATMLGFDLQMLEQGGMPPELDAQIAPMVARAMEAIAEMMKQEEAGEQTDPRVVVAQIKAETDKYIADLKADADLEERRLQELGQSDRNKEDNAITLMLAGMKARGEPNPVPAKPNLSAPTHDIGGSNR